MEVFKMYIKIHVQISNIRESFVTPQPPALENSPLSENALADGECEGACKYYAVSSYSSLNILCVLHKFGCQISAVQSLRYLCIQVCLRVVCLRNASVF